MFYFSYLSGIICLLYGENNSENCGFTELELELRKLEVINNIERVTCTIILLTHLSLYYIPLSI